jgi:hypothetical protein
MENHQTHHTTSSLPIWEGRGDRSLLHPHKPTRSAATPTPPGLDNGSLNSANFDLLILSFHCMLLTAEQNHLKTAIEL